MQEEENKITNQSRYQFMLPGYIYVVKGNKTFFIAEEKVETVMLVFTVNEYM